MKKTNRRSFVKSVGIVGTSLVVGGQFIPSVSGIRESSNSWTTFRGNANRTGATTDSGPRSNITTEWSFDMNGGMATTEPIVNNGIVYLAVSTVQSPSSSNGYVAAYDVEKQALVWKRDHISRPETPTIGDGTIYFSTSGSESASASGFFALNSTTGEIEWQKPKSADITDPLFTDGKLYVSASDGVSQLDPNSGDTIWTTSGLNSSACYANGKLFYEEGIAVRATDGSILWDVSTEKDQLLTVFDGLVYSVVTGSETPTVKARSTDDGAVQWTYSLDTDESWWKARLVVANEHVFFRVGNAVQALHSKTGTEAWRHEVDAELTNAPAVGNNTLYIAGRTTVSQDDGDAVVFAIDTASGDRKWEYSFGSWDFDEYGPAAKSPVIADGRVYTTTYPMGSTLDWMYTEYADFHILGSDSKTTTTDEQTSETTTDTTGSESTTTSTQQSENDTKTTSTKADPTTTTSIPTQSTTQTTSTITEMNNTTTNSMGGTTEATTTTSDGQPGFGILSAIGGLVGVGTYLYSQFENTE